MLHAFFWVITRRLEFICRRFGTLCLFHLLLTYTCLWRWNECSETSAYKLQTPGNYPKESIQHTEHGESLKSRTNLHSYFAACHVILEWFWGSTDVLHMTVPHQRNEVCVTCSWVSSVWKYWINKVRCLLLPVDIIWSIYFSKTISKM